MKTGGSLARNAHFDAPTYVSSRVSGFPLASPCLWGKLQSLSFSTVSKPVVMSFCVAGRALRDIRTCLQKYRKPFLCGRRSTLASLSKRWDAFFVAGAALWTRPSSFCVTRAAVWRCAVVCFVQIALPGLRQVVTACKSRGRTGMLWDAMTLRTLHSTLYTPQSTLCTWHSTLHTPHFTL